VAIQAKRHDVALPKPKRKVGRQRFDRAVDRRTAFAAICDDREDPVTANDELLCLLLQLYLWPHCPEHPVDDLIAGDDLPQCWRKMTFVQREKLRPVFLLAIDDADILDLASVGAFDFDSAAAWKAAVTPGVPRRLIAEFLDLHTAGQLDQLCDQWCIGTGAAKTKPDKIDVILDQHCKASPLALPKCLSTAKPKRSKR
ncbi:MAG: hypothetical protein ACPGWS_07280, partial [Solirubrobacterales bacterium]